MGDEYMPDISKIECNKENIDVVRTPARKVSDDDVQENRLKTERAYFENMIRDTSDLDDPLDPYLEYINWTLANFPPDSRLQSGLIDLLQKCTHDFKDDSLYKNDPRYLKVWLEYIKYSESPIEIFTYLYKKKIGLNLSLYFENFANYLEKIGNFKNCSEVYKTGLGNLNVRPYQRLINRYVDFKERLKNYEREGALSKDESPIFGNLAFSRSSSESLDQIQEPELKRQKLTNNSKSIAKPIFNNEESNKVYKIIKVPGKKDERWDINLDLLYPENDDEYCLEEILLMSRGLYCVKLAETEIFEEKNALNDDILHISPEKQPEQNVNGSRPPSPTMTMFSRAATDEVLNMFNQPLSEEIESSREVSDIKDDRFAQAHLLSSEKSESELESEHDHEHEHEHESGKTKASPQRNLIMRADIANEANGMPVCSRGSEVGRQDSASVQETQEDYVPSTPHNRRIIANNNSSTIRRTNLIPFMTPITERSENNNDYETEYLHSSPFVEQPNQLFETKTDEKSDVVINPLDDSVRFKLLNSLSPPLSSYEGYKTYYKSIDKLNTLKKFIKSKTTSSAKASSLVGSKNSMIEFDEDLYCIREELGEGGYATVYLAESLNGELNAIKIEKPSNPWEFYILKTIEKRLSEFNKESLLKSIIKPKCVKIYQDEGYLMLDYVNQGTILDVVNIFKSSQNHLNGAMDEKLVVFLTIELLKTVEALHEIGIIHGDLKPDNCMIRFKEVPKDSKWNSEYDANGNNGWSFKGITVIDFGRAIDMKLFPDNVQFKSNWETDNQDCPEMVNNETWTYQTDYFGLANIIHTLLFGETIEIIKDTDGLYVLKNKFKRYWQKNTWESLFSILLNSKRKSRNEKLPIFKLLKNFREIFEDWLKSNCNNNGNRLKEMITQLEIELNKKRSI
ncbi:hypothetical protein PACTADRAFT_5085 [Pachysolen tannophilus NRRL Y-2460]|uniref:Protein kinase domain-containing protein n=1 Tax=Pachysolen tannophilus NRRL Y-2460 TaxID=669874 RepID=A0A1E4TNI4_PACTA|nr:hypothetical protein PACTADRAFT_5085 [Pachysolen tannophilus NRRL Y-2460]